MFMNQTGIQKRLNRLKKFILHAGLMLITFSLVSCSSLHIADYKNTQPNFDLFQYFTGNTKAYGQFTDRSGKVIRRFKVDIIGTVQGNTLTLHEKFYYLPDKTDKNGEKQTRTWTITKIDVTNHQNTSAVTNYIGTASDVIGVAKGSSQGFALNWQYQLNLPYKGKNIAVTFNDWMYQHNDSIIFNQAKVSKFGFFVGEVNLVFIKA